mmetsp:Transcript_41/g.180  ORF Transcript_41/g.180 Transcript_41/m.180 type:complete len:468 (+) Transcript_41:163-1566(+)
MPRIAPAPQPGALVGGISARGYVSVDGFKREISQLQLEVQRRGASLDAAQHQRSEDAATHAAEIAKLRLEAAPRDGDAAQLRLELVAEKAARVEAERAAAARAKVLSSQLAELLSGVVERHTSKLKAMRQKADAADLRLARAVGLCNTIAERGRRRQIVDDGADDAAASADALQIAEAAAFEAAALLESEKAARSKAEDAVDALKAEARVAAEALSSTAKQRDEATARLSTLDSVMAQLELVEASLLAERGRCAELQAAAMRACSATKGVQCSEVQASAATQSDADAEPAAVPFAVPAAAVLAKNVDASILAELAAVRAFAHLHDLVKVATIQDGRAEADGLRLRCEAAGEREALLKFNLSAAGGRGGGDTERRLGAARSSHGKAVDANLAKQLKALEQRAATDAGCLSANRLRDLLPGSKQKQVDATKRREDAILKLLQALGAEEVTAYEPTTKQLLQKELARLHP